MPHIIDEDRIREFFQDHIYVEGCCAEVRVLRARIDPRTRNVVRSDRDTTVVGWFTRPDELYCELMRLRGVSAYVGINPATIEGRPAEAKNRLVQGSKGMFVTGDDIACLRYTMIDIDPPRIAGQEKRNSSEAELQACRGMAADIIGAFGLSGHSLAVRSGNGVAVLIRLPDWPNEKQYRGEMQRYVQSIASKYSTVRCHVDPMTYHPHQGVGIPGTWKFKGKDETPDRPYRLVTLDDELNHADAKADADRSGCLFGATA